MMTRQMKLLAPITDLADYADVEEISIDTMYAMHLTSALNTLEDAYISNDPRDYV